MKNKYDNSIYSCPADNADGCDGNTYAYVYPSDTTQKIYICLFTFDHPDYAEKVQTVIHELSHFDSIGGTTDNSKSVHTCMPHVADRAVRVAYGQEACYDLAQDSATAAQARSCADSYGYFAM